MSETDAPLRLPREHLTNRLVEDLVGPRAEDESLRSRPSDVYLTGILWPRNTEIAPEEDERLAGAPGEGDEGEEAADAAAQSASAPMRRPATAGLSFAARSAESRAPQVEVRVHFATYIRENEGQVRAWSRQIQEPPPIALTLGESGPDIPINAGPPGVRLNVRTASFDGGTLATVTLVNDSAPAEPGRTAIESITLFQVALEVTARPGTQLIARPSRRSPVDEDDWSGALLYRDTREFAAGHTCSADWEAPVPGEPEVTAAVRTTWLPQALVPAVSPHGHEVFRDIADGPVDPLSADWLSRASETELRTGLSRLCDAYGRWIGLQAAEAATLSGTYAATAIRHLRDANGVLDRMRAGVDRVCNDRHVGGAFRLANLAMATQRSWAREPPLRWRPFQLGFVLLALESTLDGEHPDRGVMDLLWFPTGGGKTEAYLALVAMVAFHRRLSRAAPDDGAGVAVIMRYTLRLLTTQQFIRAAAVICACEAIRRGRIASPDARALGDEPFAIGLWVGDKATPNSRETAYRSRTDPALASPQQLLTCPCCHGRLVYEQAGPTTAVTVSCPTAGCGLSQDGPLPIWTVDDDVFAHRPTLVIGTVDKFAQIVRNRNTSALFGVGSGAQPQLILQDELHLISGPLGTLAGLYESAMDLILSADGPRPKVIGSTATIRRAAEQVLALFDRGTCQFPPPGLNAGDSGFAVPDPGARAPARRYLGVSTAGRSAKFTLQAVAASILQSAQHLIPEGRDPYWTLLTYFNALRELGGALVLMQDDVNDTIRLIADWRNEAPRQPRAVEELTSRRSQQDIRSMLDQLDIAAGADGALDVVLATNMVSVGVDIRRLGLMVMNGQPKTMAEYIQATSRVGRGVVAGLVVAVLNNAKPRDRSHFETFRTWHSTLYREVEATSVTPFASRARDRALHAVLVAVVRHMTPGMDQSPVLDDRTLAVAELLVEKIAERAHRVDPMETAVRGELLERLQRWMRRAPQQYWSMKPSESLLQSAEEAAARRAAGRSIGQAWPTPNNMRGVEPATPFRLTERLRRPADAPQ